jgi:DNA-3-methyladenine glycosylase II
MNLETARHHLQTSDTILAQVIAHVGDPQMHCDTDAWRALSSSIIGQQVSVHAARAIRGRFAALENGRDFPLPQFVTNADDETLRGAGLSRNKVLSVRDLAQHISDGLIDFAKFDSMSDEEVVAALIPVRGIGRWTAEMFLIFSLGREDVLAVDDLGLRNAMKKLYALEEAPSSTRMREIASPWRPFRSVASWYLWRALDNAIQIERGDKADALGPL